jgi:hypothetical protein
MNRKLFLATVVILCYSNCSAQLTRDCLYVDPNILIVNCGEDDRYKLAEAVAKIIGLKAKVIALDFIFFDKRPADPILVQRLTKETPIILPMGDKNDSSYFKISNCYNGPRSITGNEIDNVEFLFPFVKHNDKLRDSFELLTLKYFDNEKYSNIKNYLMSVDLTKLEAKAKIEFNGNSFSCFHSIDIRNLDKSNEEFIKDKIVILGYFGTNPDIPLEKDKDKSAFKIRMPEDTRGNYMYASLISANIISNLIRKEIRKDDMKKIEK